jgi:PAS domain S-box-containing protein
MFGLLLGAVVLASIANIWAIQTVDRLTSVEVRRLESFRLADELRQSSDDLTRMARSFAATGEQRFRAYFEDILEIRAGERHYPESYSGIFWDFVIAENRALQQGGSAPSFQERMRRLGFGDAEFAKLREAERNSNDLTRLEAQAMHAVVGEFADEKGTYNVSGPPDQQLALRLLFGNDYHLAKARIMRPIQEFFDLLNKRTLAETQAIEAHHRQFLIIAIVATLLAFALSGWAFLFLRASVVRPLADLQGGIEEFRVSRTAVDIPHASRDDEIGVIAMGFQTAAREVASYIDGINAAREALSRGQAELQEREERIRSLIEVSPLGFTVTRPAGDILLVNDALRDILGYAPGADVVFDTTSLYKHREEREGFIRRLLRDGTVNGFETVLRRTDGSDVWVVLNSKTIDYEGELAIITWVDDITARKQAEEALADSEAKLRNILETSPAGVAIVSNATDERVYCNRRFNEMFSGDPNNSLVSETIVDSWVSTEERLAALEEILNNDRHHDAEAERKRLDGSTFWCLHSWRPVDFWGEDAYISWQYDITERKAAEEAVRDSENRLRNILETSPAGISVTSHGTGRRLYANPRFNEMFGAEDAHPMADRDIANSFADPAELEKIRGILAANDYGHDAEVLRLRDDGKEIWLLHSWRPVSIWGEDAFICWHYDITQRREAEEEARAAKERAETALAELKTVQGRLIQSEKMASLGQLTAGIAHEIKNPLNFVNNFSETSIELLDELKQALEPVSDKLDEETRDDVEDLIETVASDLQKINHHGGRADSIVKSMLLQARGGDADWVLSPINDLVEEAFNLAYHGERARDSSFQAEQVLKLDDGAGEARVVPQDITRVLVNLFSNAFYAVKARGREQATDSYRPQVEASTGDFGETVEIRIRDNGTGIPDEVKDRLFDPFFTTKPANEGTGLGLSMCYDLVVQQHGGQISVDSEPGAFTEFVIELPRHGT